MRKPARSLNLDEWLTEVKQHAASLADSGGEIGACLVSNPQTGQTDCVRTDAATCSKIGGTFLGGPCGPFE